MPRQNEPVKGYLTIRGFAAIAKVSPQAIYQRISKGEDNEINQYIKSDNGKFMISTEALKLYDHEANISNEEFTEAILAENNAKNNPFSDPLLDPPISRAFVQDKLKEIATLEEKNDDLKWENDELKEQNESLKKQIEAKDNQISQLFEQLTQAHEAVLNQQKLSLLQYQALPPVEHDAEKVPEEQTQDKEEEPPPKRKKWTFWKR